MNIYESIKDQYDKGKEDYWMPPLNALEEGIPAGTVGPGDTLLFCCRRGEREIQLTECFTDAEFSHFPRKDLPRLNFATMVRYHEKFSNVPSLFPPVLPEKVLADVLTEHGKRQVAITESEKEAHVTYFFNGRRNSLSDKQEKIILQGWKNFQEHPEMKSREIGEAIIGELEKKDFILVNFPAGDVIGHLKDFDTKVKSIETVDSVLGRVYEKAVAKGFTIVIAADHGLIEKGRNPDGSDSVAHTTAPVRFILIDRELGNSGLKIRNNGSLRDVAPTILELMKLPVPEEMTGSPLLEKEKISDKVLFIILDGWGIGENDSRLNPIYAANTPVFDRLVAEYPNGAINASGEYVGLPEGRSGNSETGHLTMGSGRVIKQDELRIGEAIADGFRDNPVMHETIRKTLLNRGKLHLLGMLTEASSHGSIEELIGIAALAKESGVRDIVLHLILDGRSSPPKGSAALLEKYSSRLNGFKIASAIGRGYALDRSRDYENKTSAAYKSLVFGEGIPFDLKG